MNEIDFNEKAVLEVLAVIAALLILLVLAWEAQEKAFLEPEI